MTKGLGLMKRSLALATLFVFAFAPAITVEAAAGENAKATKVMNEKMRTVYTELFKQMQTKEHVLNFMFNAEVPIEAMKTIGPDIEKRFPEKTKLPKLTVEADELKFDGNPTGIRFKSYSPVKLEFRGNLWTYKNSASPESNYFALTKFLTPETKTGKSAMMSLLVPDASAFMDTPMSGALWGAGIAGVAGALLGFGFGGPMGALVGGLGGAAVGSLVGNWIGGRNEKKAVKPAAATETTE